MARNVFITGANSGIGAALARHYAARAANVGLFARRPDALAALAAELPAQQCATYAGDVRDPAALDRAARDFIARFGAPAIVVANAGVSLGALTDHPEDLPVFRTVIDTNVIGMVNTFAPFIAAMRAAGGGTLAGIASVAGFRGLAGSGAYSASKAAAITYLESLRLELRDTGIAVVTICPGYIATPMTATNPYRMPFLLDLDKAARLIARAIERRKRFYVLPWQMAIVGFLLRRLPRPIYDALLARAPRRLRHGG
ncbi:MAG TPA: SDR family oxidoreductase [Casimicrobiaceae bacterium]|nr:SDR family oxidoreductase [Casimicrobiaceae bacterium]